MPPIGMFRTLDGVERPRAIDAGEDVALTISVAREHFSGDVVIVFGNVESLHLLSLDGAQEIADSLRDVVERYRSSGQGQDGRPDAVAPASSSGRGAREYDLALAYAEALLDDVTVRHPGLGEGSDGDAEDEPVRGPDADDAVPDDDGLALADAFEVLLERALQFETELSERGYVVGDGCRYDTVTFVDDDGHVSRRMCAVVDEDGVVLLDVESPGILDVVRRCCERPLCDRVRVAGRLVTFLGDSVRFLGLDEASRSNVVGVLGLAVGLLRSLVREARDHQSEQPCGAADRIHDKADIEAFHVSSSVGGGGHGAAVGSGAGDPTEEAPSESARGARRP